MAVLGALVWLCGLPWNRLPFYIDESSIAWNAFTLSRSGCDEHGVAWPLFFRAFGEYKNPTLIYLLAAVFKLWGPGVLAARLVSGLAGLGAVLLLGWIAARDSGSDGAGALVALSGLLTPWLFEVSRLVFEVALYPLVLGLFLLGVQRVARKNGWSWVDVLGLSLSLAFLTYTYSIGRVLAPLLALGLSLFARRATWPGIARTWVAYLLSLAPLFLFARAHPGALSARFESVSAGTRTVGRIVANYLGNLSPRRLLLTGDDNLTHHVPGMGSLLAVTALLALATLLLILPGRLRDPWWRFILYGLLISPIPASLTDDPFHTLRLVAFPVFLLLLTGPAWKRLLVRRAWLAAGIVLTLVQGAVFQRQYQRVGPLRSFDRGYLSAFDAAVEAPARPICLLVGEGRLGYIQALWYGTLRGLDTSAFLRVARADQAPEGALVIGETESGGCETCRAVFQEDLFTVYERTPGIRSAPPD